MAKRKSGLRFWLVLLAVLLCLIFAGIAGIAGKLAERSEKPEQSAALSQTAQVSAAPPQPSYYEDVDVNSYDFTKFTNNNGVIGYDDGYTRVYQGIDVSQFQGAIDWAEVARQGIDFAMIRVGYRGYYGTGLLAVDERYEENITGALENGIEVGVYFFSQAISRDEALEEAIFVADLIRDYDITFPVAYDWEPVTHAQNLPRTNNVSSEVLTACAKAFCMYMSDVGYNPIIYFNQQLGYNEFYLPDLDEFDFWLAQYDDIPSFHYDFAMWQYTSNGRVEGIGEAVDRNLYFVK